VRVVHEPVGRRVIAAALAPVIAAATEVEH
jgi:hypothetical protein